MYHRKLPRQQVVSYLCNIEAWSLLNSIAMPLAITLNAILRCYLLYLLTARLVNANAVCTKEHVGQPSLQDCLVLYDKLPFAKDPPEGELVASRVYVEPQFLVRPFSAVKNPYPQTSMVQLPKVWRYSELRHLFFSRTSFLC